jgi:hypothetical protein
MLRTYKAHLVELSLILGGYLVYLLTRGLGVSDLRSAALDNAGKIVSLEQSLGIFWEPGWQAWALENAQPLVVALNWVYIGTYWPIILLLGLLLYLTDRRAYYYYRNVFLVCFVFALVVFTLFPLAPPFDEKGRLIDTIQELGPSFYGGPEMAPLYNTYAAMPSLHFTWTAVLGIFLIRRTRGVLRSIGVAYPVFTFFAITITGNHFIVDAVAGGVLAGVSLALMELWARRRGGLKPDAG